MGWQDELKKAVAPSIQCRDSLRKAACLFAGMNHMQPLLLATTNSHYLLDRFCMERCCSSEYISRIVTSIIFMEILSILVVRIALIIGIQYSNIWSDAQAKALVKYTKEEGWYLGYISTIILILILLGYIQILYSFTTGGKKGHMHWFYASLLIQHFLNSLIAGIIGFWEVGRALWYLVTLPMAPIIVFFYQLIIHSWIRSHGPRDVECLVVERQILLATAISCIATIFWMTGYVIPYTETKELNLTTPDSPGDNITTQEVTFKVYTVNSADTATISAKAGTVKVKVYSITLSSGGPVYPGITVQVQQSTTKTAKVIAGVDASKKTVTIKIKQTGGRTPEGNPIWSGKVTGVTRATISKITLESADQTNLENIQVDGQSETATVKGYAYSPYNGFYISKVKGSNLWNSTWDGGECYYAEYYKKESGGDPALLKLHISGGDTSVRYYGKKTTNDWKKIPTEAKFCEYLDLLKRTGEFTIGSEGNDADPGHNTNYNKALFYGDWSWRNLLPSNWKNFTPVAYPLLMQGLSVGAVGSIFPNLIPKTLTCPKTTRNLSVINMFLVTLPHIFNVMLTDNDMNPASNPWTDDSGKPNGWPLSLLLYIFYILAILFAIFNIHYPEWRLSCFLRNNTWFVFLMILFTDVLNETFNAISRAGICSQRSAHTPPGHQKATNHPCLHNKIACLMNLTYIPFWMTSTKSHKQQDMEI